MHKLHTGLVWYDDKLLKILKAPSAAVFSHMKVKQMSASFGLVWAGKLYNLSLMIKKQRLVSTDTSLSDNISLSYHSARSQELNEYQSISSTAF